MGLIDCNKYLIRRRMLTILGADLDFYNDQQVEVGYCHQKAFKLKEDIRIFTTKAQTNLLTVIKARQTIDFNANYDVYSADEQTLLGTWKRQGIKSIIQDSWQLSTAAGTVYTLEEDSTAMALLRRFLSNLIPQTYYLRQGNELIATFKQNFNPFVYKLDVTINKEDCAEDLRLLLAAGGALLATIEGKQK